MDLEIKTALEDVLKRVSVGERSANRRLFLHTEKVKKALEYFEAIFKN